MSSKERVIALGFFDGVHLGHAALLRRTVEEAAARGAIPAVFTFVLCFAALTACAALYKKRRETLDQE